VRAERGALHLVLDDMDERRGTARLRATFGEPCEPLRDCVVGELARLEVAELLPPWSLLDRVSGPCGGLLEPL
jgi:hypothetical protein